MVKAHAIVDHLHLPLSVAQRCSMALSPYVQEHAKYERDQQRSLFDHVAKAQIRPLHRGFLKPPAPGVLIGSPPVIQRQGTLP